MNKKYSQSSKNLIFGYFDGLCQPYNPRGVACFGFMVEMYENESIIQKIEKYGLACEPFSEVATNNVAEYVGLINLLRYLIENNLTNQSICIYGDSQLVVNQTNHKYRVKSERLLSYFIKTKKLFSQFENISINWIPREKNNVVDKLSKKGYEEFMDKHYQKYRKNIDKHMATKKQLEELKNIEIIPEKYMSKIEVNRIIKKRKSKSPIS